MKIVFFLRNTCQASKRLSSKEIEEAIDLVNELAFNGFTREVQQLVFSREEITNENILKLCILSGTKTLTGFRKTSSVQFLHETVQEYFTAAHVTKNLKAGNRKPWEKIKEMYRKLFRPDVHTETTSRKRARYDQLSSAAPAKNKRAELLGSATKKYVNSTADIAATLKANHKASLENGFFDNDIDVPKIHKVMKSFQETQSFTDEEFEAMFDFLIEYISKCSPEQRRKHKEFAMEMAYNDEISKHIAVLNMVNAGVNLDPTAFGEMMLSHAERTLASGEIASFQSVIPQIQWLQDQANSMKILFRFIVGKLDGDLVNQILGEIAELLVDRALDSDSGEALPIIFLVRYMQDLMVEVQTPSPTLQARQYSGIIECMKDATCCEGIQTKAAFNALRLEGFSQDLQPIIHLIQRVKKFTLIELHKIDGSQVSQDHCKELSMALSSAAALSLTLDGIRGAGLMQGILAGLPSTLERLAVCDVTKSDVLPASCTSQSQMPLLGGQSYWC